MATYRQAYMFTGESSSAKDAADWLAVLETNMNPNMTSRDNANLLSTRLFRKSPAKRWFNSLPVEVQRRWHLLKPEFESRWCTSAPPSLVAQISTVSVAAPIQSVPSTPIISTATSNTTSVPVLPASPVSSTSPNILISKPSTAPSTANIQNMVHLTKHDFDRMLSDSYQRGSEDGFKKGFADASDKLRATHEEAIADVLDGAREHCDEAFVSAFELGRASGIEDQTKYQQSLQKSQTDTGTQVDFSLDNDEIFFTPIAVDIPLPLTSEVGSQTSPSIFPTPLPLLNPSLLLSPAPISPTLIPIPLPAPSSPPKLNWADDSASLPIIPLIKTPRDLSALRSNNKPFRTIRHRNRRHFETARRRPTPPVHVPSLNTNRYIPSSSPRRYPHLSLPPPHPNVIPFLPPVLDWDRDPRLFELSRVLRSLGWSPSPPSRL